MDELPTSEEARNRRRDRDMSAEERALMDNASHKWFEQVLRSQRAVASGGTPGALGKRRKRRKRSR